MAAKPEPTRSHYPLSVKLAAGLRRTWSAVLQPQALAGTRGGLLLALIAIAGYAAILAADFRAPAAATVGSLSYLIVVVTAWTLSSRATILLTLAAVSCRLLAGELGSVAWVTVLTQATGIPIMAFLAATGARSLRQARKSAAAAREADDLGFLLETTHGLLSTLDVETLIADSVRATAVLVGREGELGVARAAFHRLEGGRLRIVEDIDAAGPSYRESGDYPLEWNRAAVRALEEGRAQPVNEHDLSPELAALARAGGWRGGAVAPVRAGDKTYGLLVATLRDRPAFTANELRLLEVVGSTAGLALGNAGLLDLQRRQAESAASLDEAKSEFLRLVTHELRAPLTVISGYLSLLAEGALGEVSSEAEDALALVNNKAREMRHLIDQLLDVARIEDSSLFLHRAPVDLREVVAEAAASARELDERREVDLRLPPDPVVVSVDADRIRTIVTNLVGNAFKYSPGGQPVRTRLEVGERVRVHVSDGGIGIAEVDLPRLFTRFGRLASGEARSIPGTGLGLYLSRELARLHGGEILVESAPGAGSTFTLELPARSAENSV